MERLCALYGYRRIQTPVFEDTELFARTSGQGSDVVQKEMYTFTDRCDRSLTLRPEGTAPIARAYVEHGLHREPQPQKLYTIALDVPLRRARPRAATASTGSSSVEAIGSDDPAIDAEVIQLYDTLLRRLGVTDYQLELNSIGDRECRPAYVERLRAWLDEHDAELDEETREKARTSPLRALDNLAAKPPAVRELARDRADDRRLALRRLRRALRRGARRPRRDRRRLRARADARARARLLHAHDLGVRRAGGERELDRSRGGGRYDGLVEEIGGPPTPGVGFGAGIERLLLAIEEGGTATAEPRGRRRLLRRRAGRAARARRAAPAGAFATRGIAADTDYAGRSLKGQLTQAGRSGAHTTVICRAGDALVRRAGAPRRTGRSRRRPRQTVAMTWRDQHVRRAPRGARRRAS